MAARPGGRLPAGFHSASHSLHGVPHRLPVCDPGQCHASPGSCFRAFGLGFSLHNLVRSSQVLRASSGDRAHLGTGYLRCPGTSQNRIGRAGGVPGKNVPRGWFLFSGPTISRLERSRRGFLPGNRSLSGRLGVRVPLSPQPMARFLTLCTWLLALSPGLLATVREECSQDCATCSYLLARPSDIDPLVSVSAVREPLAATARCVL